ncbi:MAG: hypothetical protein Q3M30_12420 [Candidatus Electrothrix sp. Rat3]|nr:hypothetical protein [Candidatus Electrothrix rattekaaiensis]
MNGTNFPIITGPARPEYKMDEAMKMVGKTIERIEFGQQEISKDCHQCETINIYFTDKTAVTIQVGSNVDNILGECDNQFQGKTLKQIKPNDFSTDLILFWETQEKLQEIGYLK